MFKYKGNKFASICCDLIADKRAPFNALYIYGAFGCGKSALIKYLESETYKKDSSISVCKIMATELNNIDSNEIERVFLSAKSNDIIILEDINLINNENVYYEIITVLDEINLSNKKIVFTADKKLEEFSNIPSKFIDRMKWEMHSRIIAPNNDECMNALREAAQSLNQYDSALLDEIFELIIKTEGCKLGNILSSFRRIAVRSEMNNIPLSVEFAQNVIFDGTEIEVLGI